MVMLFIKPDFSFISIQEIIIRNSPLMIFPEDMKPVLFDFGYVAYSIGLTFGMTDVGAESTEIRKTILVQSMLAFLYATTAISAIASLFTA